MTLRRSAGRVQAASAGQLAPNVSTNADLPLRGYLGGFGMTNDAGDTEHDISVAAGVARDAGDVDFIRSSSPIVKQIDLTWAAGTAAGGLNDTDHPVQPSTWYHVFALGHTDGLVDVGFDTDITAAQLRADTAVAAAGFTLYRRIGSVMASSTDANIVNFIQRGDEFMWKLITSSTSYYDVNVSTTAATTGADYALRVPSGTGLTVEAIMNVSIGDVNHLLMHSSDVTAQTTTGIVAPLATMGNVGIDIDLTMSQRIRTDESGQIRISANTATTMRIIVTGWIDRRGRDD